MMYESNGYVYKGSCIDSTAQLIQDMTQKSHRISWKTFKKHIKCGRKFLLIIGAIFEETTDKQIEACDWIAFRKSKFNGKPCYYIDWSSIEWIWVKM